MKHLKPAVFVALLALAVLPSCSNQALQEREDRRTERHQNMQDRHEIRTDARQERTDAWYDRHMH